MSTYDDLQLKLHEFNTRYPELTAAAIVEMVGIAERIHAQLEKIYSGQCVIREQLERLKEVVNDGRE